MATSINVLLSDNFSTFVNKVNSLGLVVDGLDSDITVVDTKPTVTITNSAPSNPTDGQLWYDATTNFRLFVWSSTAQAWIDASPANVGEFLDSAVETILSSSIFDKITLEGGSANGLRFRDNPYGGTGDGASITLVQKTGEDISLRIAVTNDAADTIDFVAPSINGLTMNTYPVLHTGNFDNMYHLVAEGTLADPNAPTTGEFNGKKFLLVY